MTEKDPLETVLHEWSPPEPPPALDGRMIAAYREAVRPTLWERFLRARVTVPVPVLAVAILIAAALFLTFRTGEPQPPLPPIPGYVTRIDAAGFQPLPDGAARIVRRSEVRQ